jgi:hypothetical protein
MFTDLLFRNTLAQKVLICQGIYFLYLRFFPAAFFASIAYLIASRFLVLCERLDLFFGLSVVPRFAI